MEKEGLENMGGRKETEKKIFKKVTSLQQLQTSLITLLHI